VHLAAASVDNCRAMSLQLKKESRKESGLGWPCIRFSLVVVDRTDGGFRMNRSNSTILMLLTAVLAVASNDASAQMGMRPQMPQPSRTDMSQPMVVTEDQWINSIVDHWTGSQRKSWRSLDRQFRGWVSHLVWVRTSAGRPSGEPEAQGPHVRPACPIDAFEAPAHSVAESMDYFREVIPNINWNAWANIDPGFRALAEWEMSTAHAKAQISKALKTWWELNSESVQGCLDATVVRDASTSSATIAQASNTQSSISLLDQRHEQIERRVRAELSAVDHMIAPEPIKQEAREQVGDAAIVDKYMADVDRR